MTHPVVPAERTLDIEHREGPPEPPAIRSRLMLPLVQRWGIPLLTLPPILAITGIIGSREGTMSESVGPIVVDVRYAERLDENEPLRMRIDLENRGYQPIDVEVAISPEYLENFSNVEMTPPPRRAWATRVESLEPGAITRIAIDGVADRAGDHQGVLRIHAEGEDERRRAFSTFVFP